MAVEALDKQRSLRKPHPNHHNHFAASDRFRFPAVTSALSCSTSPAAVRPNPLTTAPVQFRKKARSSRAAFQMPNNRQASACGSATVVPLRLRSRRLSAYASLFRSPNRRPKPSVDRRKTHAHAAQPDGRDFQIAYFAVLNPLITQAGIKSRQLQRASNREPRQTRKRFQRKDFNLSPH
jgi:hypothetical protein